MMETLHTVLDPEEKARMDLAMRRGEGTPPESIILTRDLPHSFPLEADGKAFLAEFGFSADVLENILQQAYHSTLTVPK